MPQQAPQTLITRLNLIAISNPPNHFWVPSAHFPQKRGQGSRINTPLNAQKHPIYNHQCAKAGLHPVFGGTLGQAGVRNLALRWL